MLVSETELLSDIPCFTTATVKDSKLNSKIMRKKIQAEFQLFIPENT